MTAHRLVAGLVLAVVASGCGTATAPLPAPVRPVTALAAPQQAVLRIDRASHWGNHPGTPARTGIRLVGRDGQKAIEIVVQTLNPKWGFYVPTLDRVLVNGKRVTDPAALTALHERLSEVQGDREAAWLSQQASHIIRFGVKFAKP